MLKRGMVLCLLPLALAGCVSKQEESYKELLAVHQVNRDPHALDSAVKEECHRHVRGILSEKAAKPQSFTLYKNFIPMEKATKVYMKRMGQGDRQPNTVFYMAEYLGEDFAGNGVSRRFVCHVSHDGNGFHVHGAGSDHGFGEKTHLPVDPPDAWY